MDDSATWRGRRGVWRELGMARRVRNFRRPSEAPNSLYIDVCVEILESTYRPYERFHKNIVQIPQFPIPVHGETELTERSEIARALQNELGSRYRAWILPI